MRDEGFAGLPSRLHGFAGRPEQAPLTLVDALAIALDWIQRTDDEPTCDERARRHEQVESDAARALAQSEDSSRWPQLD
jgi:hypothetical protein